MDGEVLLGDLVRCCRLPDQVGSLRGQADHGAFTEKELAAAEETLDRALRSGG